VFSEGEKRILVVDDVATNVSMLTHILSDNGYQVGTAMSGAEALEKIECWGSDMILLDIMMPGLDGFEVCAKLKSDARFSAIPVIFISALGDTESKIKGFALGGVDFIAKPFIPEEVLARVGTHLDLAVKQRELAEKNRQIERVLAELRESMDRYRMVAEFTYDWEIWLSNDRRFLYISPSCQRVTSYAPEEFMADPELMQRIVHPDDRERFLAHMDKHSACNAPEGFDAVEFRIVRRDGDIRWIEHICQPVFDSDGSHRGRRASNRDITERKLAEETALAERRQNAEKDRIIERQARFAALGEMMGSIAHQWRQPINAFGLILSDLEDAAECNELDRDYLAASVKEARTQIERMSATIDDFRAFQHGGTVATDFGLVELASEELRILFGSRHLPDLSIEVAGDPAIKVHAVRGDISQALFSLLVNAQEATARHSVPDAPRKIRLSVAQANGRGIITVADNGGGFPANAPLSEAFFTTKKDGSGLGLYMARRLVEEGSCGTLSWRNVDDGAEFTISLHLAEDVP